MVTRGSWRNYQRGFDLFIMLRGSLVQKGASWQGIALVDGLSKDWIGDFGLKMLFIEIHIYLASLHLAWTTMYAWSRWSRLVISNFLLLPSVFVAFSRLDSFYTISTQRILYVSRLFLVPLVPWIDKPWGNTLREKLHEPCSCGIQIGAAKEHQHRFWENCQNSRKNCSSPIMLISNSLDICSENLDTRAWEEPPMIISSTYIWTNRTKVYPHIPF